MKPDERFVNKVEHWALCGDAVNRVRPIKHNKCNAILFTGAHAKIHRPDECVVARADILKIDK